MDNKTKKKSQVSVALAAIDPYIQDNIVRLTEKEISGRPFIEYGERNAYPDYIYDLYRNVPTLQSIINGLSDYVVGDGVEINDDILSIKVNRNGDDIEDVVKNIALDYATYGGFALNVVRNKLGKVCEINYLDFKNVRSDKKNKMFFYSEDWSKSYGRVKYLQYPAFNPEETEIASSIFYFKQNKNGIYPYPVWGSAVLSAEIEKGILEFNLNSLRNGLSANVMISFCNGIPEDEVKEEIEEMIMEKYTDVQNAGRPILNFCNDKDHSIDVERLDIENFADRYINLEKTCKTELFTAFRAHPSLFGIATEGSSLNTEDYNEVYKLFNRTMVRPVQKVICNAFKKILGGDSLIIKPFTIDFEDDATNDEEVTTNE